MPPALGRVGSGKLDRALVAPTIPRIERPDDRMPLTQHLISAVLCVGILNSPSARSAEWDSGPLVDRFNLTLASGWRMEALGPLLSYQRLETQTQWAFAPWLSHASDPDTDVEEFDLGYPLLTYDRFGTEYRLQILQVFSLSGGQNQQETAQRRFTLFPLYFQQ